MRTEKEITDEIEHMNNLLRADVSDLDLSGRGILLARKGSLKWVLEEKTMEKMRRVINQWIEKTLEKFPFIKWDRFIEDDEDNLIEIYGWIERKDNYKDFVLLEFDLKNKEVYFVATSSNKYSRKIAGILNSPHSDCKRVEERFKIKNIIKSK